MKDTRSVVALYSLTRWQTTRAGFNYGVIIFGARWNLFAFDEFPGCRSQRSKQPLTLYRLLELAGVERGYGDGEERGRSGAGWLDRSERAGGRAWGKLFAVRTNVYVRAPRGT